MEPDDKKLLKKTLKTAETNQEILRKLHRGVVWGRIFRVLYILIVIGAAVGVFYFVQPLIEDIREGFSDFSSSVPILQEL